MKKLIIICITVRLLIALTMIASLFFDDLQRATYLGVLLIICNQTQKEIQDGRTDKRERLNYDT